MNGIMDYSEFHGALPGRKIGDYSAEQLPYEVVWPSGDYSKWVPTNEPQSVPFTPNTDRFNCVTQAHHNAIENILMRDIELGRMPATHKKWLEDNGYFDDNGKINFSESYNSVRNGTIPGTGNYVFTVCEDGRVVSGLIPQRMLPDIPSMLNDQYYNPRRITAEMVNKGLEFLTWFQLPYGWVGTKASDIRYHLKQAPLMVTRPGHEIVGIKEKSSLIVTVNDSYDPFIKDLAISQVADVMKVLVLYVLKKGKSMAEVINDNGTIKIEIGVPGKKIAIGIHSQKVYNWIVASGEPIIEKKAESQQKTVLEDGILAKE